MPHIHELYDFTTSAFILHPNEHKILLLKHKKIGKWLQPGGHIELHENIIDALTHELLEETGLKPEQYHILDIEHQPKVRGTTLPLPIHIDEHAWDGKGKHRHIDFAYLVKAHTEKLTKNPDGAEDIKWLSLAEIKQLHENQLVYDGTLDICNWIEAQYFS